MQSCRNHRTQPWRRSADDFVAALRNPSDPDHGLVARTYAPLFQRSLCHYYLRGLACAAHRVHFLCTETMADDWSALVARSGLNDSDHPIEHVTHNCSRCRRPRHGKVEEGGWMSENLTRGHEACVPLSESVSQRQAMSPLGFFFLKH